MSDSTKSIGRILYIALMTIYLALAVTIFSWPSPGLWAIPKLLMNAGIIFGFLLLFVSLFCLKEFQLLAILGLLISLITLAMLLLPTV